MWNFFRLENEHLNNCGEFRAVRDISIAPIENSRNDNNIIDKMKTNSNLKYRKPKKAKFLLNRKDSNSGKYLTVKPNKSSGSLRLAFESLFGFELFANMCLIFSTDSSLSTNRGNCEVNLIMEDNCELNRLWLAIDSALNQNYIHR